MISFVQYSLMLLLLFRQSSGAKDGKDKQPGNCSGNMRVRIKRACCMPDETCRMADTKWACCTSGGLYVLSHSECTEGLCAFASVTQRPTTPPRYAPWKPPPGACCKEDGSCEILSRPKCKDIAGYHHGENTQCSEVTCKVREGPGACYTADQECRMTKDQKICKKDFNGEFYGPGMDCVPPGMGACCVEEKCTITTREKCDNVYRFAEGVPCLPNSRTCQMNRSATGRRALKIGKCCNAEKGRCDWKIIKPLCIVRGGRPVNSCNSKFQCPASFPRRACCVERLDYCLGMVQPQICQERGGTVLDRGVKCASGRKCPSME